MYIKLNNFNYKKLVTLLLQPDEPPELLTFERIYDILKNVTEKLNARWKVLNSTLKMKISFDLGYIIKTYLIPEYFKDSTNVTTDVVSMLIEMAKDPDSNEFGEEIVEMLLQIFPSIETEEGPVLAFDENDDLEKSLIDFFTQVTLAVTEYPDQIEMVIEEEIVDQLMSYETPSGMTLLEAPGKILDLSDHLVVFPTILIEVYNELE